MGGTFRAFFLYRNHIFPFYDQLLAPWSGNEIKGESEEDRESKGESNAAFAMKQTMRTTEGWVDVLGMCVHRAYVCGGREIDAGHRKTTFRKG